MRGEPAPAWDSGNSTIWEDYVGIAFVVANGLILLITSVVGIAANIFVMLAVYRQKSLQTSNNALVVNLAVVDFLRCVIDCPILLTIVMTVYQGGDVDDLICDTQIASFSFSCCIQLLTLACISAERHQAIAQPFKASQRKTRIMVLIPLTWILAILVAAFCLMYLRDSPVHVRCQGQWREKTSSYDNFGLYMLFPLWAACFGVIIGFYAHIFALVRSHNRKIFDKGTFPPPKNNTDEDKQKKEETTVVENAKPEQNLTLRINVAQTQAEPNSSVKISSTSLQTSAKAPQCVSINSENKQGSAHIVKISDLETEQPHPLAVQVAVRAAEKPFTAEQCGPCGSNAVGHVNKGSTTKMQKVSDNFNGEKRSEERGKTGTENKETSLSAPLQNSQSTPASVTEPKLVKNSNGGETLAAATLNQASSLPLDANNVPESEAIKPPVEVEGAVCMMPSKANKERARKAKESKMAKRASYIIMTFLLFWLPLITTILVNFVVHKNKNTQVMIIQDVEILSVSVACITSLSDPIIYAAVNPQFRTEFYRLKNRVKTIFNKKL